MDIRRSFAWITAGLLAALGGSAAQADIVTFKNNTVMRGVVDEAGSDSTHIKFLSFDGTTKIPRSRINSIQKESLAEGYAHIGDDFRKADKFDEAIGAYERAIKEDPNLTSVKQRIEEVREARDSRKKLMRQDDIQEIDRLAESIRKNIRAGDFKKAEEQLQASSNLMPTAEQKVKLQSLIGEFYLAWAKERQDKLDAPGAEEKLNLALAAQPDNDEVINLLLKIWEGQPNKKDQTLRVYETILNRKGENPILRRKIADLYYDQGNFNESIVHYLKLFKDKEKELKGSPLEARIIVNLDRLHKGFAEQKDFKQAIYFHKLLCSIDPATDPSYGPFYQYMQMANDAPPNNPENTLALGVFAEKNGMDSFALDNYRKLLKEDPKNEAGKAALDRFAGKMVAEAEKNFSSRDYPLAKSFAQEVIDQYPESEESVLRAREIIGKADVEIQRDQREKRDQAKQYIERGDTYYQQALVFYRDIFDRQRVGQATLSTPKSDAIRYFQYAIASYEAAIRIDPTLQNDAGSLVGPNLAESRKYLARLTSGPPPQLIQGRPQR